MKVLILLSLLGLAVAQFNYGEALGKSILFYEAQRTGRLVNNRIPWRADSFLNDNDGNIDLTGGYFDAGDHVKFGLPMSAALTVLAWGVADYKAGYQAAGQLDAARDGVRWGTDWLLKATRLDVDAVYAQVGDGQTDHNYWGRPEEFPAGNYRPAFKLTTAKPGSDLAAGYAAALAAGAMALRDVDSAYATRCIDAAKQLYTFANTHRAFYHDSVTDAANFYRSYDYHDELAYAAAWLALVTGEQQYKDEAAARWNEADFAAGPLNFDWDAKFAGVAIITARALGDQKYKDAANGYCQRWLSAPRTPKGLVFINEWGSLRHASNAAFGCLQIADLGFNQASYRDFAKQQIDYALGSTGRSFVVGFGNNPPTHCHHRAASCRDRPNPCDWNDLNKADPNGQVLNGALVGGPDANDNYVDNRNDFRANEVALDYNAGFQGALAGLLQIQAMEKLH